MSQPKIVREKLEEICEKRFNTKSMWNTFMKQNGLTFDQTVTHFFEFERRFSTYEQFNEELHFEPYVYFHPEMKTLGKSNTTPEGLVYIKYIKDGRIYEDFDNIGEWEKRKNNEEVKSPGVEDMAIKD